MRRAIGRVSMGCTRPLSRAPSSGSSSLSSAASSSIIKTSLVNCAGCCFPTARGTTPPNRRSRERGKLFVVCCTLVEARRYPPVCCWLPSTSRRRGLYQLWRSFRGLSCRTARQDVGIKGLEILHIRSTGKVRTAGAVALSS